MTRKMWLPIFVLLAVLFGACGVNVNLNIERGSGHVITESRNVSNFDSLLLSGIGDVTLEQGDSESLEIEAEDNVVPHIQTKVVNGTLEIRYDRKTIIPTKSVKFRLVMRDIHKLDTQGVSNIQSEKINTDQLDVSIGGTGNVNIRDLTADQLTVNVSGAGNFSASGEVTDLKITLSGAGNFNGEDLKSANTTIAIAGLGRVTTWSTDTLDVTISGTGGVDYYGDPQVSQQISGIGSINHAGDK